MGTGTDHRTLVDLAYIVWTFDGSQPSHRPIITRSFTVWDCSPGTSPAASAPLSLYALHALTIRCECPDTGMPPTEVTFRLSPSDGLTTGHEANEWFLAMLRHCEEFEVETDVAGEAPIPVCSETVRQVVVE